MERIDMKTVCEQNQCVACGACADICPKGAIRVEDHLTYSQAVIDEEKCVACDMCHRVCQAIHPVPLRSAQKWYQGWAVDEEIRAKSSSGGLAAAISRAFVQNQGSVCSCVFEKGEFVFQFAEQEAEVSKFRGSKYVKSNPAGIYKQIKARLDKKEKVLFIGLPCQVAALKSYMGGQPEGYLYTIDLICHGTPSTQVLDKFLQESDTDIKNIENISFRKKTSYNISFESNCKEAPKLSLAGLEDIYTMSFMRGICYTENCYQCVYAQEQRCSDMTLGDSWGSELDLEEQNKGISLILCHTEKGADLLNMSDVVLKDVNIDKAVMANTQLRMPCPKPRTYPIFWDCMKKGRRMSYAMFRAYPKAMIKRIFILITTGLKGGYKHE
ncbi:MAG: Coenzyme F420 hydrogenase/dehydrogenase, beta subunit C-terminal domain [Clostridium sp.]|nr:Coenzyme F420 hydrogenase/dehydrogenase, beta subunit C-terminal domain [Clostridium sp.]